MIFAGDFEFKNFWILLNILITICLLPVPFHFFLPNLLGFSEEDINCYNYNDIFLSLHEDYERANPISKKKGNQKFIKVLKENDLISSEIYLKLMHDIENNQTDNFQNYYSENTTLEKNMKNQNQKKFFSIVNTNLSRETMKNPFKKENIFKNKNVKKENRKENVKKEFLKKKTIINPFVVSYLVDNISANKERIVIKIRSLSHHIAYYYYCIRFRFTKRKKKQISL